MPGDRVMHMDQRVPGIGDAAAEIVVLIEEKDVRIEPAEAQEQVAPDETARPREEGRAAVALRKRELAAGIAQIRLEQRARLEEKPAVGLDDARCEHPGVGIAFGGFEEGRNCAGVEDDVGVHDQDEGGLAGARAEIGGAAVALVLRGAQDGAGALFGDGGASIGAGVVDDERRHAVSVEGGKAGRQDALAVVGDDDRGRVEPAQQLRSPRRPVGIAQPSAKR